MIAQSGYLTEGTTLTVYDNFVEGGFQALETLKTNEVQAIVVAAAHLNEIQTITTSAAEYSDVQQITLTTPEGYEIDGKFAVRLPEVQVFSTRVMDADAMGGYFRLGYASYVLPNAATTDAVDDVIVQRSGYGGYKDYFGYQWSVTFAGNKVAGNVQKMVAEYGGDSTTCNLATPDGLSFSVVKVNGDRAGETTACLPWNATSEEMTVALEALAWVDEVLIERTGGGSSPDCGYTYSVYFTGNGLHVQDDSDAAALSLIVPAYDDPVCTPLAYFSDGTKQIFGATEVSIEAARVRPRGFNLPTSNATDAHLMEVMSTLPTFVDVYDVRRSLSDDRLGFKWTGNTIGGHFIVATSKLLPSDVSAIDTANELQLLSGF
ncbi:hypothetical protein B484DRAFT_424846, partial [Ochromonadaceae sp. CCMP2298]